MDRASRVGSESPEKVAEGPGPETDQGQQGDMTGMLTLIGWGPQWPQVPFVRIAKEQTWGRGPRDREEEGYGAACVLSVPI